MVSFKPTHKTAPEGTYKPVFFLSVSVGYVAIVAAGLARLGTGIERGGNGIFVRWPTVAEAMTALATQTVLIAVIADALVATLRKTRTVLAVMDASLAIIDMLSIIAPSLAEQSTTRTQPAELISLNLVAVLRAAVPPIVA